MVLYRSKGCKRCKILFSTLEGLECLLIPFVSLDRNQFWEPLRNKYPGLKNIIIDDINFILSYNREQDNPPKEHGHPYFTQRRGSHIGHRSVLLLPYLCYLTF